MKLYTHTELVNYLVEAHGMHRGVAKAGCRELLSEDDSDFLQRTDDEFEIVKTTTETDNFGEEYEIHQVAFETGFNDEGVVNFINEIITIDGDVIRSCGEARFDLDGNYLPD